MPGEVLKNKPFYWENEKTSHGVSKQTDNQTQLWSRCASVTDSSHAGSFFTLLLIYSIFRSGFTSTCLVPRKETLWRFWLSCLPSCVSNNYKSFLSGSLKMSWFNIKELGEVVFDKNVINKNERQSQSLHRAKNVFRLLGLGCLFFRSSGMSRVNALSQEVRNI